MQILRRNSCQETPPGCDFLYILTKRPLPIRPKDEHGTLLQSLSSYPSICKGFPSVSKAGSETRVGWKKILGWKRTKYGHTRDAKWRTTPCEDAKPRRKLRNDETHPISGYTRLSILSYFWPSTDAEWTRPRHWKLLRHTRFWILSWPLPCCYDTDTPFYDGHAHDTPVSFANYNNIETRARS